MEFWVILVGFRQWRNRRKVKKLCCKNMQTHSKNTGFGRFLGKNVDNGAKCCLNTFSGRRRRGCLKFPSLGSPHGREKWKKHPLEGSQGYGEIVALDDPGRGRREFFRRFLVV